MNSAPLPLLEDVLSYKNEDVVARFAQEYKISEEDSEDVFREMLRWLWICAKRKHAVESGEAEHLAVPLFNEARVIDMMWHTFLLYTQAYADFCDHYFGFFIHHQPKSRAERKAWQHVIATDPERARREREAHLKQVYEYLYEELGEATLIKWCEELPARFQFSQRKS